MANLSVATAIAIGFFVIWLGILLAGADFPPPVGFLWVIFLDVVAALLYPGTHLHNVVGQPQKGMLYTCAS